MLFTDQRWNVMSCLSDCAAQLVSELCLRVPVNPWPSTMQIRLEWVWSQSREDLFDLCWLLTEWSCYWMLSTDCIYILIPLLCAVLNRIRFPSACVSFIALCSRWNRPSRTLFIVNNQHLSVKCSQPCSLTFHLLTSFHAPTWFTRTSN